MTLPERGLDRRQVTRIVGGPAGLHVVLGLGVGARLAVWSSRALEVASRQPLRPGAHFTVRLRLGQRHWVARGMVQRCWVSSVSGGVTFGAVVLLDDDPTGILGY